MLRLWPALTLLLLAFAGCLGDDGSNDEPADDPMDDHGDDHMDDEPADNETADDVIITREVDLQADPMSGEANLTVTFTATITENETTVFPGNPDAGIPDEEVTVSGEYTGALTYTLLFGDGESQAGDESDFPLTTSHNYTTGGNYSVEITINYEDGTESYDNLTLVVATPTAAGDLPQLEFELAGPVLGCVSELAAAGVECLGMILGVSGIDGWHISLDERYWGLGVTSTIGNELGDSDCFFLDAAGAILGDAHNGGSGCEGTVPADTASMYFFSWGEPATGGTVTFA